MTTDEQVRRLMSSMKIDDSVSVSVYRYREGFPQQQMERLVSRCSRCFARTSMANFRHDRRPSSRKCLERLTVM